MPIELARPLEEAVDAALPLLGALGEPSTSQPPRPGAWSLKEELGHLLDSAANNRCRFVRGALEDGLEAPGYDQNGWVRLHGYRDLPWADLVELWRRENRLLARLIERIPEASLDARCGIGGKAPVSLRFLIEDYVRHLRHHLDHILGREPGGAL